MEIPPKSRKKCIGLFSNETRKLKLLREQREVNLKTFIRVSVCKNEFVAREQYQPLQIRLSQLFFCFRVKRLTGKGYREKSFVLFYNF